MRSYGAVFGILLLIILFFSCGKSTLNEKPVMPAEEKRQISTISDWQRMILEARKEGKVVIYNSANPPTRTVLAEKMKELFGIDAEYLTGRGPELMAKIRGERNAGLYIPDIYLGGATSMFDLFKPAGLLEPFYPLLILPEVKDPKLWWKEQIPFLDKEKMIFNMIAYPSTHLVINTNNVNARDMESWYNLLDPKWKGKITLRDPTSPGAGLSWFQVASMVLGVDYMRALARQKPEIMHDSRLQMEWLARGKYPIGIGASGQLAYDFKQSGAPVDVADAKEIKMLSTSDGNIAFFNKSPHPTSARVFINWLLSKEGQEVYTKPQQQHSTRNDVATDFINPLNLRKQGIEYILSDSEEMLLKKMEYADLGKEIFGHLMK